VFVVCAAKLDHIRVALGSLACWVMFMNSNWTTRIRYQTRIYIILNDIHAICNNFRLASSDSRHSFVDVGTDVEVVTLASEGIWSSVAIKVMYLGIFLLGG